MLLFLTGITVFYLRQTSCKPQQSQGECAVKAAEPGKLIGIGTADVWFLQFRGGFNGCVVIAVVSVSDGITFCVDSQYGEK